MRAKLACGCDNCAFRYGMVRGGASFLPSNKRFWMVASYSTIYLYGQASNIIGKSEGIVEASVS